MSTLKYLKTLVRDRNVASITPSSSFTVKKATRSIDFTKDNVIVEFGPGTGVFSEYLLQHLSPASKLIMIELNQDFAEILFGIQDERVSVYNDSAEAIDEILANEGLSQADYILSGIPFSFLDADIKKGILSKSASFLSDEGAFLAYQTSSHLKKYLEQHFPNVKVSYEWRNIPPMCIYEARK
jgi:phospholipid N-methyltransferase